MTKTERQNSDPGTEIGSIEELSEPEPPRLDVVFGVLQNERRRQVLRYLAREGATTQGDLAEQIAARENDTTPDRVTSDQRKRVYVALYQSHLPKLDDADVVDFDPDRGTVDPGPRLDELLGYIERFERGEGAAGDGAVSRSVAAVAVLAGVLTGGLLVGTVLELGELVVGVGVGLAVGLLYLVLLADAG